MQVNEAAALFGDLVRVLPSQLTLDSKQLKQLTMKNLFKPLCIVVICAGLAIANPVVAQSSDPNTTTASTNNNNDDDSGKWGLAGLLGLLGLIGLKKKDDNYRTRSTTTNTNR